MVLKLKQGTYNKGKIMFLKKFFFCSLFLITGCGFSPLYSLNHDEKTTTLTQEIAIAPIPEYDGFLLHSQLENALNPQKNGNPKKYVLNVHLNQPLLTDQSIQGDNFASRKKISLTANYTLSDITNNKVLLSSSTTALGAYNVFNEPYATHTAHIRQQEDLIKIISNNISLRIIAYFKKEEVNRESQTLSD